MRAGITSEVVGEKCCVLVASAQRQVIMAVCREIGIPNLKDDCCNFEIV